MCDGNLIEALIVKVLTRKLNSREEKIDSRLTNRYVKSTLLSELFNLLKVENVTFKRTRFEYERERIFLRS